jgi:multidrug efflux pump subunit AcrA (membrane-fusion protein)
VAVARLPFKRSWPTSPSQSITETLSLVGTLAANEMVEIKSETDGVVAEILFQEGPTREERRFAVAAGRSQSQRGLAEAEANFKLSRVTSRSQPATVSRQADQPAGIRSSSGLVPGQPGGSRDAPSAS